MIYENTRAEHCLLWILSRQLVIRSRIGCNVEWLCLKPNCVGIMVLLRFRKEVILLNIILSNILERDVKSEIGR